MPTVSVSSHLTEAVYLSSIIGLSILLARPVSLVYSASQQRTAEVVASGFADMIDSMSPGITVVATLQSYPGVRLSLVISGNTVVASCGTASATQHVRWGLARTTLYAGEAYAFTLHGGEVAVAPARHG